MCIEITINNLAIEQQDDNNDNNDSNVNNNNNNHNEQFQPPRFEEDNDNKTTK